ncbi:MULTISPECIES: LLM class flavin-dependent oxidoreductase [Microbacterium]|uniref:Flavin-dependent oxidoreductase, luciferase family (Includes alkanesulfonate monooxygenase SsuD and methylene tetrahydromethanopterin reductase) n=1 Tax=Microbacterium saccharophilum TaxID=1213358 RepID=A0A7Z7GCH1_9MICO|nr:MULTISPECIES: LLM class flavin-dependent oxidoreductase [Microbacterium]SFI17577.1 Flavin-dependent oxidoreductase, luciferase family (includes alkanesulfonate monooxygenase SsuD and methylene tetrahydromethanopterin reductase) [Microbacterium saccharophilum]
MTAAAPFEIGIFTFGELTRGAGGAGDPRARLEQILEWARVADQAGLDVFGVGEHHRPDFAVSSPQMVLAAVARETDRIRLTSTVTVLSSADPVRLFEEFATLDLLSGGRAELTAGRGAYVESFPLFGQDLRRYDEYFDDRLDLLLSVRAENPVTWSGTTREPLQDAGVWPRPLQEELPVWIAVGGTPESAVRAGALGLPTYLAILGAPRRFRDLAALHRDAAAAAGHAAPKLGVTSHFFAARTTQEARDAFFPHYAAYFAENMPRGGVLDRATLDTWAGPDGALFAGSPAEIVDKILWEHEMLGHTRFLAQVGLGGLSQRDTLRSIELLATEVLPEVRRAVAAG